MKKLNKLSTLIFTALYLAVHFLPAVSGADPMGFQWLYVSVIDIVLAGFILFHYSNFKEAITGIFKSKLVLVYSLYFVWALASYFYALNKTETLVCLARLVSTFLLFVNLSVLFYKKDILVLFKQLAFLVALVALADALFLTIEFFWQMGRMPFDNLVLSLRSIAYGNKNIRAASILINVPFILYYITNSKMGGRVFGLISLCFTIFALFILNTRSTFVGLILIFSIYTLGTFIASKKAGKKWLAFNLLYFIIPVIIAFVSSNLVINYALKLQKGAGGYGTVAKRMSDITIEKGGDRLSFWSTGIDYAKNHLIIGDGYGNWKLSSLFYEKEQTRDFVVRYHLHNDFIENFADLGVIGGLLYLGIFLVAFLFTIHLWRKQEYAKFHFAATISLMAITCYFVDAALNFPVERTVMQVMFAISAAILVAPFSVLNKEALTASRIAEEADILVPDTSLESNKTESTELSEKTELSETIEKLEVEGTSLLVKGAIAFMIILIAGSIFINAMVYKSLRLQRYMMADLGTVPVMTISQVEGLPSIPNLSFNTLPLPAMLARYYIKYKKYNEALRLLNADANANPYFHYNDFVRSQYFTAIGKNDSALIYAKKAFYNWPTANIYYYNLMPLAIQAKDTIEANKAFNTYVKFRNESNAWNTYLNARISLMGTQDKYGIQLADSALKQFPNDSLRFTKLRDSLQP